MREKLGIIVPACGEHTKEALARFLDILDAQKDQTVYPFELFLITDAPSDENFSIAAAKNRGIRDAIAAGCTVIAAVDVDTPLPPGLIDFTVEATTPGVHLWVTRRDIPEKDWPTYDLPKWAALHPHGYKEKVFPNGVCWGSFNAMRKEGWLQIGGFDERCIGYGGEDDLLHLRVKQSKFVATKVANDWPLAHVNHPHRPYRGNHNGQQNLKRFQVGPQPNFLIPPPPPRTFEPGAEVIMLSCPARDEIRRKSLQSFLDATNHDFPVTVLIHGEDVEGKWPDVRAEVSRRIKKEFVVWLEDDWLFHPFDLQRILAALRDDTPKDAVGISLRAWPAPSSLTTSGFRYRTIPYSGGMSHRLARWANYSMAHWPSFSFNPGVFRSEHFTRVVEAAGGDERRAGEICVKERLKFLSVYASYAHHIGEQTSIKGGHTETWPLFTGARQLLEATKDP
jgi:hypothetical protein